MLPFQRFFCWPLLLLPCTVPCKIVLANPADLDTCPNHFNTTVYTLRVYNKSWWLTKFIGGITLNYLKICGSHQLHLRDLQC